MSDIHIYLERTHPIKVITLEPTGARGPIGPAGATGPAGPNSVTSDTTSNGTASLDVANVTIFPSGRVKFFSSGYAGSIELNGESATDMRAISFPDADGTVALTTDITDSVTSSTTSDGTADLWIDTLVVGTGTASGDYSVAIGTATTASGSSSFSSGFNSVASGDYSVAIGSNVEASGYISYAFGDFSVATADYAYAIGVDSRAIHIGASVETDSQQGAVESITTDEKVFSFLNGYRFLGGSAYFEGTVLANHIHGNLAGSVYAHVRAGEALLKGDPVYVSGSHGTGANLIPIVSKADASNSAKMPAIGIMDADLANNASGHMVITGTIADLNTAAYSVNATLYVASGGGLTATPPAANSQPVARVERSNTNNGALIVKVNGLASSGGNGASDANKLVRFSSTGTIPVASIGGLGTGVATALAVNTGTAGAFVVNGGALGTPSSGTLTSCTGLPVSTGISGLGTGVATALGNTANATGGFVTVDGSATLTNKTLTTPTINSINQSVGNPLAVTASYGTSTIACFQIRNAASNGLSAASFVSSGFTQNGFIGYANSSSTNYADEVFFCSAAKLLSISTAFGSRHLVVNTSGDVSIGSGASANSKSVLDLTSTTKGFLPPRMTTTQRDAITSVPAGLMIYNTSTNKLNFYNGSAWEAVTSS